MLEKTERLTIKYINLSQKWSQTVPNYNKQYCNIYLIRLREMSKLLHRKAEEKWGTIYPTCKLHKLSEEKQSKCIVIGTLFKNQKLKPSILKQLSEGNQLIPQPVVTHCTDPSDELYIEDELQRYLLVSRLPCDNLVTGISCALLGTCDDKGKFIVEDYTFVGFRNQVPRPIFNDAAFIVFLSGFDMINSAKFAINLQLLLHWLSGLIGDIRGTSKVARIIIAGNCVRNTPEEEKPSISLLSRLPDSVDSFEAVKLFDKFLLQMGQIIDVDIMPGCNDPSNYILPQKPMHYCMFPEASVYKSVNQVSNPYYFSIGGVKILGTSGQTVNDIMKFSNMTDTLKILECCLQWNHIAPTAPDTLGCFPFYESDPFIIEECPHVFFSGNQKEFSTVECIGENGQKVTLISIPQFASTFQACVLNLETFECNAISFQTT